MNRCRRDHAETKLFDHDHLTPEITDSEIFIARTFRITRPGVDVAERSEPAGLFRLAFIALFCAILLVGKSVDADAIAAVKWTTILFAFRTFHQVLTEWSSRHQIAAGWAINRFQIQSDRC